MPSLELGCGYHRDPRCDVFMDANRSIVGLDHYGNAEDPLPWPAGHFDLIVAHDVLEHLSFRHTDRALTEWARVTKPGGLLDLCVPDGAMIMRWFSNRDARLTRWENNQTCTHLHGAQWRLYGGQGDGRYASDEAWRLNSHYAMFDHETLTDCLDRAGFDVGSMVTNAHPNILATAVRR